MLGQERSAIAAARPKIIVGSGSIIVSCRRPHSNEIIVDTDRATIFRLWSSSVMLFIYAGSFLLRDKKVTSFVALVVLKLTCPAKWSAGNVHGLFGFRDIRCNIVELVAA